MSERKEGVAPSVSQGRRVDLLIGGQLTTAVSELINRLRHEGDRGLHYPGINLPVAVYSRAAYSLPEDEYRYLRTTPILHNLEHSLKFVTSPRGDMPRKIILLPEVSIDATRSRGIHFGFNVGKAEMLQRCLEELKEISDWVEPNEQFQSTNMDTMVPPGLVKSSPEVIEYVADAVRRLANGRLSETVMTVGNIGLTLALAKPRVSQPD